GAGAQQRDHGLHDGDPEMKTLAILLLGATAALAQPSVSNARFEARAFSGDLAGQLRASSPTWFGYAVKTVSKDNESCCWENDRRCGCHLESGDRNVTIKSGNSGTVKLEGSAEMAVLFRVAGDRVDQIRG